jgi:hypothetical protein
MSATALYQRLKELDRDGFEKLCFHLLKERFPDLRIMRVEGAAGDDGADCFVGPLESGSIVWQAKSFPNGIKNSQKDQIRQSLKRAVAKIRPKDWVLCLSVDLDIQTHRWWQNLVKSYASKTRITLWTAAEIVAEVAHRKTICELFFPGAVLDTAALRALVIDTAKLSQSQLTALAQENSEQLLDRLKMADARFDYELVVSPENTPGSIQPKAMFSVKTGRTSIHAYARDVTALRLDPPKVRVKLRGAGVEKMRLFVETGQAQVFDQIDFGDLTAPLLEVINGESVSSFAIGLGDQMKSEVIPLRVSFGNEAERIIYEYVPFRIERGGSKELKLVSDWLPGEPFQITAILADGQGTFTFEEKMTDFRIVAAHKWIRALEVVRDGGTLELYLLSKAKQLASGRIRVETPANGIGVLAEYADFFKEASEICEHFKADLYLRRVLNEEDESAFTLLRHLMTGEPLELKTITTTTRKTLGTENFPEQILTDSPLHLQLDHAGHSVSILDSDVNTGPYSVVVEVRSEDNKSLQADWERAALDEMVTMRWEPSAKATLTRRLLPKIDQFASA